MNFLAHLYLSRASDELMIGNFIGDFVKGRNLTAYRPGIQKGIELHRSIDSFTDGHQQVSESKKRLRPRCHHYAGVVVDIFYDHFLASHWSQFSKESLTGFADRSYRLIQSREQELPDRVKQLLPYMIRGNWLKNYSSLEGINRSLSGMTRRTSHPSGMEDAVADLKIYYESFGKEFMGFFPDVVNFADHWIETNYVVHDK